MKLFNSMKCAVYIFSFFITADAWPQAYDQVWLASDIKMYTKNSSKLYFYMEGRFVDNGSNLKQFFYGPRYSHKIHENWSVGFSLKSVNLEIGETSKFRKLYRGEAEVIFGDTFGERGRFDIRNRVESIKEPGGDNRLRYRPRARYRYVFREGIINNVFFSQELIYENVDSDWSLSQKRFVPLGVTLNAGDGHSVVIFILHQERTNQNFRTNALGLTYRF